MKSLIKEINNLRSTEVEAIVNNRLAEFDSFKQKNNNSWFSELCFCILAANSRQKTAETIQKSLGSKLLTTPQKELSLFIKDNKHRFHNNKAKYIVEARKHRNIKDKLKVMNETEARSWLVNNVKGIGMKEASHFLRNTGSPNLAILDRHILRVLHENNIINNIPSSLSVNTYVSIESEFLKLAKKLNIPPAKLDLFMWYMKTGRVEK